MNVIRVVGTNLRKRAVATRWRNGSIRMAGAAFGPRYQSRGYESGGADGRNIGEAGNLGFALFLGAAVCLTGSWASCLWMEESWMVRDRQEELIAYIDEQLVM